MSDMEVTLNIKEQFIAKIHSELNGSNRVITELIEELLNEDKLSDEEIGKLINVNNMCNFINCWLYDYDVNKENVYEAIMDYISIEDMVDEHDVFDGNSCDYPEDF